MLQAGTARAVITSPLTVPHAGWGAQTHVYPDGVHYDLWATVLCLAEGEELVCIADLDLCYLTMPQADRLRERIASALGIDRSRVRISTSHTHAGPFIHSNWYKDHDATLDYIDGLFETVVRCAAEAAQHRVPVRVAAGYGECGIGKRRIQKLDNGRIITGYDPAGATDPTVGTVKIEAEDGTLLASLLHFACHPTTLGPDNKLQSPDYPGVARRVVEQLSGGHCLFLLGAAGDIGPGPEGFRSDYAAVDRMGTILGCEAAKSLLQLETVTPNWQFDRVVESGASLGLWTNKPGVSSDNGRMVVALRTVELPLKPLMPTVDAEQQFLAHQSRMQELIELSGSEDEIRDATYKVKRSHKIWQQSLHYYGQTSASIEAHFVAVSGIVLAGVPVEPFSFTGKQIREASPFACTLFGGYTNGWLGYLPTADQYAVGGYEIETSPFAEGAAEHFANEIIAILHELHHQHASG
ncbi:hypothetical protein [Paenibacillus montanisoli]|uniref:Neutral/alkaline non-lysosomal ceramidase N-terminal domain-containing protein n=1 Tax=Paenibacillus montanisoli TaxID=2081970 RepID=A0A328TSL0_9BACL|nr:hypothetical protein [Paenibacillus montanisoli]RAP73567.1 hypothetical protein DL346_25135 [Paenibacillus montanisoli]